MEANNGNMEEYKKDRGEYAARLFSLGYITNRSKANWKEKQVVVFVKPGDELNDEDIYDAIRRANFTVGKRIK